MGRPPCCDKVGIKKGPWTPEEDIILVSYIQEHGPGNWRSVPTNTGLLRCSKSCRLRWTNYLRPGIKRGNFTPHEEGMIIHLQALLGNKWAAIASYLPQRTDNDIKNYWNTHLKKKIKKFHQSANLSTNMAALDSTTSSCTHHQFVPRSSSSTFEVINEHHSSSHRNLTGPISTYASSTENISRLLEGWMRSSPKAAKEKLHQNSSLEDIAGNSSTVMSSVQCYRPKLEQEGPGELIGNDEFDSILSFENQNDDDDHHHHHQATDTTINNPIDDDDDEQDHEMKMSHDQKKHNPPLSFLEKWLLDETAAQGEEMIDQLSPIF